MGERKVSEAISEKARGYFEQGFNRDESISLSFKEYLGVQDSLFAAQILADFLDETE